MNPLLLLALLVPTPQAITASSQWTRADFDGDGLPDLLDLGCAAPARLLRGLGQGRFEDVTTALGLAELGPLSAASWADLDGDGDLDLLTGAADGDLRSWLQQGTRGFVEHTTASGLAALTSAVVALDWVDLDGDMELDLHVRGAREERFLRHLGAGVFEDLALDLREVAAPAASRPTVVALPEDAAGLRAPEQAARVPVPGQAALGISGTSSSAALPLLGLCAPGVADLSTGQCLPASSMPQLGALLPLSVDFNLDLAGNVGLGTTSPTTRLDVVGGGRFSGALEGALLRSNAAPGTPPLSVGSSTTVPNLSADLLDGFHASAFSQLGSLIETAELDDKAVTTQKLANQAVTAGQIAPGAVLTVGIKDGAVTTQKLATKAVTANELAPEAVLSVHLKNEAVTLGKLDTSGAAPGAVLSFNGSSAAWGSQPAGTWTPISSLPFAITQPGAYYLTGNLSASSGDGIDVLADHVLIDLMGYTLDGSGGPTGNGIHYSSGGPEGTRVRNGTITGWGGMGIDLQSVLHCDFANLLVSDCGGHGILAGSLSRAIDVVATSNGGVGIFLEFDCVVQRCVAGGNATGIAASIASVVLDCRASFNGGSGFLLGAACIVERCTATGNSRGFETAHSSTLRGCLARENSNYGFLIDSSVSVEDCAALGNHTSGFRTSGFGVTNCRLIGNRTTGGGAGFDIQGGGNLLAGNTAFNAIIGFDLDPGNHYGQIVTGGAGFHGVDPWANFDL